MVILAKTAGFCFGVGRAVKLLSDMLDEGKEVATLGPIIHNPVFVDELKNRGVIVTENPSEVPDGYTLVLRTHGVCRDVKEELDKNGTAYTDATCPFVSKIQNIVSENTDQATVTLIAGDSVHPEVRGIMSYCRGEIFVFNSDYELEEILQSNNFFPGKTVIVVSQTTFNIAVFEKCESIINEKLPDAKIFHTICRATSERQEEARRLSKKCDLMIVAGGRNSSNTKKLGDVCRENCPTMVVETAGELNGVDFAKYSCIGITAGASTPANIIEKIVEFVKNSQKSE